MAGGNQQVDGLPLIPDPTGADVYAPKDNVDYRVRTGQAGGLATLDGTGKLASAQKPTYTKTDVGLANVDNTSDVSKPVSSATQAALDLKANLSNPSFSANVTSTSGNYLGAPTVVRLAPSSSGAVYLRPSGSGSTAGQVELLSTGQLTLSGKFISDGVSLGTQAASSATDVTRHLDLAGGAFGLSYTASRMNYIVPASGQHEWYSGTASIARLTPTVLYLTQRAALGFSDTWLTLNPTSEFTSGVLIGVKIRSDGGIQTGAGTTSGFFTSSTTAPQWQGIELGYRKVPLTAQNGAYTFVAGDSGKGIMKTDTSAYTYTVNNGVFAAGDVLTVINNSTTNNVTIAAGAGMTLRLAGPGTTGSRTVAPFGMATIIFVAANGAYVSGPGVT